MKNKLIQLSIFLSFVILLSFFSFAADFGLKINDKPLGKYLDIYPGKNLKTTVTVEKGVRVLDVSLKCSSEAICAFLKDKLSLVDDRRYDEKHTEEKYVYIHHTMPAGDYDLELTVTYEDEDGNQKEYVHQTAVEVKSDSTASSLLGIVTGWASEEVTYEIINKFQPTEIKRLEKDLNKDDLRGMDLSGIGLDDNDIEAGEYEIQETGSQAETVDEMTDEEVGALFEMAGTPLDKLKAKYEDKDKPVVRKSYKKFKIVNPETGEETYATKVMISIYSPDGMNNIEIVDVIPKDWADNSKKVYFVTGPVVLEADPIVKWNFGNLPPDKTKDYAYVIEKDVDTIDSQTIAVGNKASWFAKFIRFCLNGGWIAVLIVLLLIIILVPVILRMRRSGEQ